MIFPFKLIILVLFCGAVNATKEECEDLRFVLSEFSDTSVEYDENTIQSQQRLNSLSVTHYRDGPISIRAISSPNSLRFSESSKTNIKKTNNLNSYNYIKIQFRSMQQLQMMDRKVHVLKVKYEFIYRELVYTDTFIWTIMTADSIRYLLKYLPLKGNLVSLSILDFPEGFTFMLENISLVCKGKINESENATEILKLDQPENLASQNHKCQTLILELATARNKLLPPLANTIAGKVKHNNIGIYPASQDHYVNLHPYRENSFVKMYMESEENLKRRTYTGYSSDHEYAYIQLTTVNSYREPNMNLSLDIVVEYFSQGRFLRSVYKWNLDAKVQNKAHAYVPIHENMISIEIRGFSSLFVFNLEPILITCKGDNDTNSNNLNLLKESYSQTELTINSDSNNAKLPSRRKNVQKKLWESFVSFFGDESQSSTDQSVEKFEGRFTNLKKGETKLSSPYQPTEIDYQQIPNVEGFSCYIDSLIVALFVDSKNFDYLLNVEDPSTFAVVLKSIVLKLRNSEVEITKRDVRILFNELVEIGWDSQKTKNQQDIHELFNFFMVNLSANNLAIKQKITTSVDETFRYDTTYCITLDALPEKSVVESYNDYKVKKLTGSSGVERSVNGILERVDVVTFNSVTPYSFAHDYDYSNYEKTHTELFLLKKGEKTVPSLKKTLVFPILIKRYALVNGDLLKDRRRMSIDLNSIVLEGITMSIKSVVVHRGYLDEGHYVTYVRHSKTQKIPRVHWILFDGLSRPRLIREEDEADMVNIFQLEAFFLFYETILEELPSYDESEKDESISEVKL